MNWSRITHAQGAIAFMRIVKLCTYNLDFAEISLLNFRLFYTVEFTSQFDQLHINKQMGK